MIKFPPILIELWNAVGKIIDKLTMAIQKIVVVFWHVLVFLFDKFVDLIKYIADKL